MSLANITRQVVAPVGLAVVGVTSLAWYVTLLTTDSFASLMMPAPFLGPSQLALFLALMTTMMIAMMLPATLPMILSYRGMLKSNAAASAGVSANVGTSLFMSAYFLVWTGFGLLALLALTVLGLMGPRVGATALIPGIVLIASGAYQATSVKQACLRQCQSPFTFMMHSWKKGPNGAFRMGLSHSMFCLGCCWLFMIALFVTGAMSLLWMGAVSVMIFVEKVGISKSHVSRGIGLLLLALGVLISVQAYRII